MTTLTTEQLAAIRARAEQAMVEHPAPWWWGDSPDDYTSSMRLFDGSEQQKQILKAPRRSVEFSCYYPPKATADFIAHSLTDVLALLAALDQAHAAEKARVRGIIEAEQNNNRMLYAQAVDQQEDARADYRMARIHALADLLGQVGQ